MPKPIMTFLDENGKPIPTRLFPPRFKLFNYGEGLAPMGHAVTKWGTLFWGTKEALAKIKPYEDAAEGSVKYVRS